MKAIGHERCHICDPCQRNPDAARGPGSFKDQQKLGLQGPELWNHTEFQDQQDRHDTGGVAARFASGRGITMTSNFSQTGVSISPTP